MPRHGNIVRNTSETNVSLSLSLDVVGESRIQTGIGFFDHLLAAWSKHSGVVLALTASGDLHVDQHHTVEDVGIALGQALNQALGDRNGIVRFGYAYCPLDEALVRSVVDISGRGFFEFHSYCPLKPVGQFQGELLPEFLRAIAINAKLTLHVDIMRGSDQHHIQEALMKSFARAFRMAVSIDSQAAGIPSTKGVLV